MESPTLKKKDLRTRWSTLLILALIGLSIGCSHGRLNQQDKGRARHIEETVASPLTTQLLDSRSLSSINSIAVNRPTVATGVNSTAISPNDAYVIIDRIARETMTLKVLAPESGASSVYSRTDTAKADAWLKTEILRFEHRKGSAFGGEPAAVSFRMTLERIKTGQVVWAAQFFLRQEALSENLLRLGERVGPSGLGAGWRTAHEVFERGVASALRALKVAREEQFLQRGAEQKHR